MNCNDQYYCSSPETIDSYPSQSQSCAKSEPQYIMIPETKCFDVNLPNRGAYPDKSSTVYVLSSQEKVDFLKRCCASPVLRFILHLLSDPRQESLVSWHGGPFGVKIWNTRKFTDGYNMAMGTRVNFTNISRALQACEQITIAGIRLWKRKKQGEYSFFPCYTGHGLPNIPPTAMPKDVPAFFPFERRAAVKTPQSRSHSSYGHCSSPPEANYLLPAAYYGQTPPCPIFTPDLTSPSTSHLIGYQPIPQFNPQLLSPVPSLAPFSPISPAYSMTPPSFNFPVPFSLLTPPPSDTSKCSSDSFSFNESLASEPYSPVTVPISENLAYENEMPVKEAARILVDSEELSLDSAIMDEFFSPSQNSEPKPAAVPIPEEKVFEKAAASEIPEGEDIFGNVPTIAAGYDLSIDETSLLYH